MAERRRARRIAKRVPVRFGTGSFRNTGFTVDASESGLFIAAMQLPEVGALLDLELQVAPDFSLQLHGFVVRHKVVPPALRTVAKGGFALRLLTPEEVHDLIVGRGEALTRRRAPRAPASSPAIPTPQAGLPGLPAGPTSVDGPPPPHRLACRFSSPDELARAWQTQVRHGGLFVRSDAGFTRDAQVIVEVQLAWLGQRLQFAARVVQATTTPTVGVALLFQDATHARAVLGRFLPAPETGGPPPSVA